MHTQTFPRSDLAPQLTVRIKIPTEHSSRATTHPVTLNKPPRIIITSAAAAAARHHTTDKTRATRQARPRGAVRDRNRVPIPLCACPPPRVGRHCSKQSAPHAAKNATNNSPRCPSPENTGGFPDSAPGGTIPSYVPPLHAAAPAARRSGDKPCPANNTQGN